MTSPVVLTAVDGPVGVITLNRPARLNAWTGQLNTELFDALERFDADEGVRVIVVTGAGRGFCAGADLGGLNDAATKETGAAASAMPETRPFLLARTLTKPVIAAINGPVAGIGLAWSLTCDMRFTNKDSKFSCAFSKRGLVAEWGTSFLLPRLVGTGNAMLYLMSSEVFLGEEATRIGIAQRCFDGDVLERTVTFAKQLAANVSPVSMATMKQQLWRHPLMADDLALHESVQLMKASLTPRNEDFKEGVQSFLEKRQAAFKPLSSENPVRKAAEMLFPAAAPKSRL